MIVALALVVSGLAIARSVIRWWDGPRSIGLGIQDADALAMSPDGRILYAANQGDGDNSDGITVINLATGRAGGRIDISGGSAWKLAMMPGGRVLYALVSLDDNSDGLVRIALPAQRVERTRDRIAFRYGATDMVAAPTGSLLYVLAQTSRNSMAVIPVTDSGQEGKAIPVPADALAMAISPDGRMLYIGTGNVYGSGSGEVIPVDTRTGKAMNPFRFPNPVIGLAVSPGGGRLFGLASDYPCGDDGACRDRCDLVSVDIRTGAALWTARLDSQCDQIEVAPGRRRLFVHSADNILIDVDSMTGQVVKTIRTTGFIADDSDTDFLVAPDGRTAYVSNQYQGVVVVPVTLRGVPRKRSTRL